MFSSPVKTAAEAHTATTGIAASSGSGSSPNPDSPPEDLLPPVLGKELLLKPLPSPNSLVNPSPVSPGVQKKIEEIEKQTFSTSDLNDVNISRVDKRKSEFSPETSELSRKEKKQIREEEKKQDKMRKKLEYQEKNSVQVLVNHSY